MNLANWSRRKFACVFIPLLLAAAAGFAQHPSQTPDADGRVIYGRDGSDHWRPYMADADMSDYHHAPQADYERFKDLKYGLRIHWGIYSLVDGQESWVIGRAHKGDRAFQGFYYDLYKSWDPSAFNANEWADMMTNDGFKFFVFTTKHHDGFSMYDTQTKVTKRFSYFGTNAGQIEDCDLHFSIMETPFHRDVTKELVDAARKRGLAIGLYFSHPDWYDADFRFDDWNLHLDTNYTPQTDPQAWERFEKRHEQQLVELLTKYGPIDMLSLDMWFPAFAWPHQQAMIKDLRKIQPDCMFRWRGIGNFGDYQTPENYIPGGEGQGTMPWQDIHALSTRDIFSYEPDARYLRNGEWIVKSLIDVVAKGGNFMVGIGPDLTGKFHPKALEALAYAGDWLKVNGEAIYATRPRVQWREGDDVRFTQSKDHQTVYILSMKWPGTQFTSKLVAPVKGSQIHMLGVKEALPWHMEQNELVIRIPDALQPEANRPCKQAYVFKVTVNPTES